MDLRPRAIVNELADTSLVDRARAGDQAAFGLLVEQRRDQLYRTAWAILRSDADALDAAQETCINAWRELPRLRDPGRFDAWLTRSLVNRCRDMLRARKRVTVREIRMGPNVVPASGATGGGVGDEFTDSDTIRRAFGQLKAADRTLLALHYADGRPIAEIAAILGAPAGTVKWRLSRARAALEQKLAREER